MSKTIEYADYGDCVITTNIEDLKKPGKWLFFRSIWLRDKEITLYPESVSGDIIIHGKSSLSLPLVTSIEGNVTTFDSSSLSAPILTSVSGDIIIKGNSRLSAPLLLNLF